VELVASTRPQQPVSYPLVCKEQFESQFDRVVLAMPLPLDELLKVFWGDSDGIRHADVRKFATLALRVDGRTAEPEPFCNLRRCEKPKLAYLLARVG